LLALPAALDDQHAFFAAGVLRLIPLEFSVSYKTGLVAPVPGIWLSFFIKLIRPDQFPTGGMRIGLADSLPSGALLRQNCSTCHHRNVRCQECKDEFHAVSIRWRLTSMWLSGRLCHASKYLHTVVIGFSLPLRGRRDERPITLQ